MGGERGRHDFCHAVAKARQVDAGKQRFATSQNHRGQGEVDLVDDPGEQIVPDGLDAATDFDIEVAGGGSGQCQGPARSPP